MTLFDISRVGAAVEARYQGPKRRWYAATLVGAPARDGTLDAAKERPPEAGEE